MIVGAQGALLYVAVERAVSAPTGPYRSAPTAAARPRGDDGSPLARRSGTQWRRSFRLLSFLGALPVAVPGLVYGIGLLWAYIQTPLYGTAWVLLMAYIAKFLPYGIMVSRSGILQIDPELEQSARMSGAGPLHAMVAITMPLMRITLVAILFFVMLQSIKELSASVLLYTQKSQVLSVLTWHYMDSGNYQFAAAIGVVQTLIMVALVLGARRIFGVQLARPIAA